MQYSYKSSEFPCIAKVFIEIISVSKTKAKTCAQARMTVDLKGTATSVNYTISRNKQWLITSDGIVMGGRKEYPIPPNKGCKWNDYPDSSEIISMSEKINTPAGRFSNSMKVVTMLSGGDSGSSVRYYAPGAGYVFENYASEDIRAEVKLVSFGIIPDSERYKLNKKKGGESKK